MEHYKGWGLERLEIKNKFELLKYEEELKILFRAYLLYGGFPEALKAKELSLWHRDLVELYGIRTPSNFLTFNTSETFSYSSISRNLGIRIESVINYVGYLIEAYLIGELKLFSKSIEKTLRAI